MRGVLYDSDHASIASTSKSDIQWEENLVEIQKEPTVAKTEFQTDLESEENPTTLLTKPYDFEKDVKVWSDFMYTRLHPRTVHIVKEYQHCNPHTPFDAFPLGTDLWNSYQFEDTFSDKIRNYIEECDSFQVK